MANNRELSQVASFINVDDTSRNIGIGVTNPVQITVSGNLLFFNVVGVESVNLTLS